MKRAVTALLAGSALVVCAAAARADTLSGLKEQIERLSSRVGDMGAAQHFPAEYKLIAISEGPRVDTPGLRWSGRENSAYGNAATYIVMLSGAKNPSGTTITWSGYTRAGFIYVNTDRDNDRRRFDWDGNLSRWVLDTNYRGDTASSDGDISVRVRGQIRATASTGTSVGNVGVDIRLRENFSGNGAASIYSDVAWGYWAMTPELNFGGGYSSSLGKVDAGLNGDCVCYYTDNSSVSLDPGDVSQLRLFYSRGPFQMGAALEDASFRARGSDYKSDNGRNPGRLGAAGEITYVEDGIYAEISGVWRDFQDYEDIADIHGLWQVGAGLRLSLSSMTKLSLAAAYGQGPVQNTYEGEIVSGSDRNNNWWGVSGLASANLRDDIHAEIGAGYMKRDLDRYADRDGNYTIGGDWSQWTALAGLYYSPVAQLTFGVEGEWIDTNFSDVAYVYDRLPLQPDRRPDFKYDVDVHTTSLTVDFVSVWRF